MHTMKFWLAIGIQSDQTIYSYSHSAACCGYLKSNQKVLIHTTRIKKVIAKCYSSIERSKLTDKR